MFFPIILLTFLQILHSKIPSPGKLAKTRHIWRHDLQSESTGSWRSELIGDSCSRCERVDNSALSWVELCRYKRALTFLRRSVRSLLLVTDGVRDAVEMPLFIVKRNASMRFVWYEVCCNFFIFLSSYLSVRLQISRRRWHRWAWNFAWWYTSVPGTKSPLWGGTPKGPKIPNFDREYLENGKSQRYVSIGA